MNASRIIKLAAVCSLVLGTGACTSSSNATKQQLPPRPPMDQQQPSDPPRQFQDPAIDSDLSDSGVATTGKQLFAQAKAAKPEAYAKAVSHGARIRYTSDGKSFAVVWMPKSCRSNPSECNVITSLHGHEGWAFEDFNVWYPYLNKHKLAIVSLQWWFGQGDSTSDYYAPDEIYSQFTYMLKKWSTHKGNVLLHGFSRGSANIYAVQAIDNAKTQYFAMTIANSGGAHQDYAPTAEVSSEMYGAQPFSGTYWYLYCGKNDTAWDLSGCSAMTKTKQWIVSLGGNVRRFVQENGAGHGGFHMGGNYVEDALDTFESLT